MTEAALDHLLQNGSGRLRWQVALRRTLVVLGVTSILTAAGIFAWRMSASVPAADVQRTQTSQALLAVIPFCTAAAAFALLYALVRPTREQAAFVLDRAAQLQEHLITWLQLRGVKLDGTQAEFRTAQAQATVLLAANLPLKHLLPLHLPAWTPVLWLSFVALGCALLVPPNVETESHAAAREREQGRRRSQTVLTAGQPGEEAQTPGPAKARVQPLSPTELLRLQLKATDPTLSNEQKKQLLGELQQKIGAIPESELTEEIRDLLSQLRSGDDPPKAQAGKNGDSSQQKNGLTESTAGVTRPSEANTIQFRERGLARAQTDFVDVRDELIRYYRGGAQQ